MTDRPASISGPSSRMPTLHDSLVAQLRVMLLEGDMISGAKVPEAALCRRFGVSRTPMREALKVMAAEGLVILRPNRGAVVAPLDPSQIGPIFELKGALERLIGLTTAERARDDDIAAIGALHQRLGEALSARQHETYTRLNYDFHQALAKATGNPVLFQCYDGLQQKLWRYRFVVNEYAARLHESYAEHDRIMIALHARMPLDLADRLEAHNRLTAQAMVSRLSWIASQDSARTGSDAASS